MKKSALFLTLTFTTILQVFSSTNLDEIKNLYQQRDNEEKLNQCIALCEKSLDSTKNAEVAIYLAKAYYFKGESKTETSEKLALYDKGVKAGEIGLSTIEGYAKAMEGKDASEEEALKEVKGDDVTSLYWTAANLARYAKYASFSKKLAVKNRIRYMWDYLLATNPDYNYGGAYRFFGGYFSLVPSITGDQDPVKSKEMFEKAVSSAPQYLETKVLYAEAYCTHAKIKDVELFRKLLNEVISEDVSKHEEIAPENNVAKEKAKALLAKESELFED